MSLFLPFRNVTVVGVGRRAGAEPLRSAALDRRPIDRSSQPHPLSTERAPARSARRVRSADLEETGIALIAPTWPAATFGFAAQLFIADHRQYCPQLLVAGDSALVDLPNLVKDAIGELNAVVADRKPAIGMIDDGHPLANRRLSLVARLQDEDHLV